jgi:hypothetical protein
VSEAGARLRDEIVDEVRRVVRTIDDEVVPEVRRNSSSALKAAATRLQQLAERLDDSKRPAPPSDGKPL